MTIIETVAGDSAPDQTIPITREDGTDIDLTGATVRLRIQNPKTKTRTNDASNTCSIIRAVGAPGTPATVVYSWTTGGTDCPDVGTYRADLQITYVTGKVETYPLRIEAVAHV